MWLLSTSRAELHYFIGPEAVPGGYAILSHVWEGVEQTHSETRALEQTCARTGANPRDHASEKVRRFCELAEKHGHKWGWADTCCIDKLSSAELSEAINSMYRYYSMAEVCYAYLFDVPKGNLKLFDGTVHREGMMETDSDMAHAFASSRWHERGWTLQELIAPDIVVFVSQEWTVLGAKADLPNLLNYVTGIPQGVLTLVVEPSDLSIAQRMSWAANRETTRPEDEAYSLMGIFDVNMPTLYGEGRRAFRRLQEEIMKKSIDTSLLAWQRPYTHEDDLDIQHKATILTSINCPVDHATTLNLFAETPRDFGWASAVTYQGIHYSWSIYENDIHGLHGLNVSFYTLPTFTITPHGLCAKLPVIRAGPYAYAMLLCSDHSPASDSQPRIILLTLVRCKEGHDRARPLYHARGLYLAATVAELSVFGAVKADWEEIYIVHEPSRPVRRHLGAVNASLSSPFRVSSSVLLQKLKADGVVAIVASKLPQPWDGSVPLRLRFQGSHPPRHGRIAAIQWHFVVSLGCCANSSSSAASLARWATVTGGPHSSSGGNSWNSRNPQVPGLTPTSRRHAHGAQTATHNCSTDHVESWVYKDFPEVINYVYDDGAGFMRRVARGAVRLLFMPSLLPATDGTVPTELRLVQILDTTRPATTQAATSWRWINNGAALLGSREERRPSPEAPPSPGGSSESSSKLTHSTEFGTREASESTGYGEGPLH